MEPRIKKTVRWFGGRYRLSPEELEGAAREAFVKAVLDYQPEFGTKPETLINAYVNSGIREEAKTIKWSSLKGKRIEERAAAEQENHLDEKRNQVDRHFDKDKQRVFEGSLSASDVALIAELESGKRITNLIDEGYISFRAANKALARIRKTAIGSGLVSPR
jgi:DNA-directed RNA polymerase specialized sigma subunit